MAHHPHDEEVADFFEDVLFLMDECEIKISMVIIKACRKLQLTSVCFTYQQLAEAAHISVSSVKRGLAHGMTRGTIARHDDVIPGVYTYSFVVCPNVLAHDTPQAVQFGLPPWNTPYPVQIGLAQFELPPTHSATTDAIGTDGASAQFDPLARARGDRSLGDQDLPFRSVSQKNDLGEQNGKIDLHDPDPIEDQHKMTATEKEQLAWDLEEIVFKHRLRVDTQHHILVHGLPPLVPIATQQAQDLVSLAHAYLAFIVERKKDGTSALGLLQYIRITLGLQVPRRADGKGKVANYQQSVAAEGAAEQERKDREIKQATQRNMRRHVSSPYEAVNV